MIVRLAMAGAAGVNAATESFRLPQDNVFIRRAWDTHDRGSTAVTLADRQS